MASPSSTCCTHWVWWWFLPVGQWRWQGCGWRYCWGRPGWPGWSSSGCQHPLAFPQGSGCCAWAAEEWMRGRCPQHLAASLWREREREMWLLSQASLRLCSQDASSFFLSNELHVREVCLASWDTDHNLLCVATGNQPQFTFYCHVIQTQGCTES